MFKKTALFLKDGFPYVLHLHNKILAHVRKALVEYLGIEVSFQEADIISPNATLHAENQYSINGHLYTLGLDNKHTV